MLFWNTTVYYCITESRNITFSRASLVHSTSSHTILSAPFILFLTFTPIVTCIPHQTWPWLRNETANHNTVLMTSFFGGLLSVVRKLSVLSSQSSAVLLRFSVSPNKMNGLTSNMTSVISAVYHVTWQELAEKQTPTAGPLQAPQLVASCYSSWFSHKFHEKKNRV